MDTEKGPGNDADVVRCHGRTETLRAMGISALDSARLALRSEVVAKVVEWIRFGCMRMGVVTEGWEWLAHSLS